MPDGVAPRLPGAVDMPDNPPGTPIEEIRIGGVVCSCPCHRLVRVIDRLGEKVVELEAELVRTRRHLTRRTTGYGITASASRAEIDRLTAKIMELEG